MVEVPAILLYGTTDEDAEPYLIQLFGVGPVKGQVTRAVSGAVLID